MKKLIFILLISIGAFAQNNPDKLRDGVDTPLIRVLVKYTNAELDALTNKEEGDKRYSSTDSEWKVYDGTNWVSFGSGGGSQTLQQTTDLGATTSNAIIIRNNSTPSLTVEATDFNKFISVSYDRLLYNSDGFNFNLRMPATLTGNYDLQVPNLTQNDTIATQSYVLANSGINYTASNGIGLVGNDFQLGGAFSKNIGLTSTNNDFQLIARSTNQTGSKLFLQEAYSLFGSGISFLEFDDNSATGVATLQIKNKTPVVGQVLTVESILGNRARLGYATPSSANGDFVDLTTNQTITSRKTINATGQSNLLSISDEDFDGIVANNSGNSAAIKSTNTAAGRGIVSNGASSSTGEVFVGQNNNVDTFLVNKEGDITANSIDVGGDGSNVLLDDGTTTALPNAINTVPTEITYAASMPLAFTETQPNRYVTLAGNGTITDVTGTLASGDLIILEIKGTGTITLTNGDASTKDITVSGTPVIANYYVLSDGNGKWFIDENSGGSGAVAVQTATGDGTTTIDWTVSPFMDFTFGAQNETITMTPPTYPEKLRLKITQDGTGSRTISWVNNLYVPSGALPTLSTGANDIDVINIFWNGVNFEIDEDFNDYQLVAGTDVTAPSVPSNLATSNETETTVDLTWTAATDNVAVTNYNVYKDGVLEANLGDVIIYTVTGLTASTSYDFTVTALDAAGNESAVSNTATTTTSSAPRGSIDISAYTTLGFSVAISNDGTTILVNDFSGLHKLVLSTPYDESTAIYDSYNDIRNDFAEISGNITAVRFKSDDSGLVLVSGTNLVDLNFNTPFDVTDLVVGSSFDFSATLSNAEGFDFTNNKAYIVADGSLNTVYQFSWSGETASTLVYDSVSYGLAAGDSNPRGFSVKPDGTAWYFIGIVNNTVYAHSMIGGDLSTTSFTNQLDVSGDTTAAEDIDFDKATGNTMIIIGRADARIYFYDLSTGWNITTSN